MTDVTYPKFTGEIVVNEEFLKSLQAYFGQLRDDLTAHQLELAALPTPLVKVGTSSFGPGQALLTELGTVFKSVGTSYEYLLKLANNIYEGIQYLLDHTKDTEDLAKLTAEQLMAYLVGGTTTTS